MQKGNELVVGGKKMSQEQMELIRRTVAKGSTNDELSMFLHIANKQELDPFLKEIYYYKDSRGNNITLTSRDGFLKKAHMNPDFSGLQSCEVREGDEFYVDYDTMKVHHKMNLEDRENKKIIGAWAAAFKRGAMPSIVWVDLYEYDKKQFTWNSHKSAMIRKVAEVRALKNLFGITGLTSFEEMGIEEKEGEILQEKVLDVVSSDDFFNSTVDAIKKQPKEKQKELLEKTISTSNWTESQKSKLSVMLDEVC